MKCIKVTELENGCKYDNNLRSRLVLVAYALVPVCLRGLSCGHAGFVIGSQGSRRRNRLAPLRSFQRALCSSKGDFWLAGFSLDETLMAPRLAMRDPFTLLVKHHRAQWVDCADLTQPFLTRCQDGRGSREALESIATYLL